MHRRLRADKIRKKVPAHCPLHLQLSLMTTEMLLSLSLIASELGTVRESFSYLKIESFVYFACQIYRGISFCLLAQSSHSPLLYSMLSSVPRASDHTVYNIIQPRQQGHTACLYFVCQLPQ